jgi:Ras-related protein Rab-11A
MTENIDIKPCEDNTAKEEYKFKVVIVGDSGVGKTNLVKRFITNTFYKDSKATVGVEFLSKSFTVNGKVFKLELWDTAGQERYKSITSAYFKGAKGALVVYDVTAKPTFDNVDKWCSELQTKGSKNINIIMVGNKTDLKENIVVTSDMGKNKAANLHIPIMETSALDASNVKEAFYLLIKEMYLSFINNDKDKANKEISRTESIDKGVSLDTEKPEKKTGCC